MHKAHSCLSVFISILSISYYFNHSSGCVAPPRMRFANDVCWYCRLTGRHVPSVYGLAGISSFLISIFSVLYKGLLPLLRPSPATCSLPLHSLLYSIVRCVQSRSRSQAVRYLAPSSGKSTSFGLNRKPVPFARWLRLCLRKPSMAVSDRTYLSSTSGSRTSFSLFSRGNGRGKW